ncbi:MAG: molybdopterin-dependent oxidoreductase [Myxococcota bacterium]
MGRRDERELDAVSVLMERRSFLQKAVTGTTIVALGGFLWKVAGDDLTRAARAETRPDGRPRLPPGQRVLEKLKPMGGEPGDPLPRNFRLKVHGNVATPFELDFRQLVAMPEAKEAVADVHCVTGWSCLGARWRGVPIAALAKRAGVKPSVRHLIFEAANGYTANVRLEEGLAAPSMIVWEYDGEPLPEAHGAPVRGLVPDLYFWKSPKFVTGLRFEDADEPGYWETRGYHNHADPWKEERYG